MFVRCLIGLMVLLSFARPSFGQFYYDDPAPVLIASNSKAFAYLDPIPAEKARVSWPSYYEAGRKALDGHKLLVVFVNTPARDVDSAVVCWEASFERVKDKGVLLGLPNGKGSFYRKAIPEDASDAEIWEIVQEELDRLNGRQAVPTALKGGAAPAVRPFPNLSTDSHFSGRGLDELLTVAFRPQLGTQDLGEVTSRNPQDSFDTFQPNGPSASTTRESAPTLSPVMARTPNGTSRAAWQGSEAIGPPSTSWSQMGYGYGAAGSQWQMDTRMGGSGRMRGSGPIRRVLSSTMFLPMRIVGRFLSIGRGARGAGCGGPS